MILSSLCFCANRARLLWTTCLASGLLVFAASAQAQDMTITPAISSTGSWDSNPMMRKTGVEDLYGVTTVPSLSFKKETPTWDFLLSGRLENNVFDDSSYNSNDGFGALKLARRTERLDVGLSSSVDYDTTRTSETTDFGSATDLSRHLAYRIGPSMAYALSPISKVALRGSFEDSTYEKESRTDYHTLSLTPSYERDFSERYTGVLSVRLRRYEADSGSDRRVDSIGPTVGLNAELTQQWSGNISVGQQASREKPAVVTGDDWTWSTIFSGGLRFEGEQDMFTFQANRSQQSYNNGTDVLLTSLNVDASRRINPLFSVRMGLGYQFSDDENATVDQLVKKYTGSAGLTYHLTEAVGVTTSYSYRQESYTGDDKTARQNIARLGISYKPQFDGLW
jgi:hypothetical protein